MHKKIFPVIIFFISAFILFPGIFGFADISVADEKLQDFQDEWTLERYTKYFYNRYSTHFDESGFFYMAPDYNITKWKKLEKAREYVSMAFYYKYRAKEGDMRAKKLIKEAVFNAKNELAARPINTQSFEDAEAFFLITRIYQYLPELFTQQEKDNIFNWMKRYIEAGIKVPDTENRAIISATHWQYLIDYLGAEGYINFIDKKRYSKMIKDKIDFAIRTNITKDYWYIEGRYNDFTPHYHGVSAYMLMIYSKLTGYNKYNDIAYRMYLNLKRVSFNNGMVEARIGHRPIGLGAQFYLMAGMLGKAFEDKDYTTYLFYSSGSRFFSDPKNPNRLEYHSTIEGTEPEFHDDYSFIDAAELALTIPSLKAEKFRFTYFLSAPDIIPHYKFIQRNNGREIIFNGKKIISGSYGNWARIILN